ncbi:DUF2972 domain-containing protein, partial [Campylobacter lari]|nr:DUF2972 domain-containing protein [Campylobacter lari]EMC9373726.1 DUF2972 domain-containing protein [Campylobacter lari]
AFGLSGHAALNLFLQKSLPVVSYLHSKDYIYSFSEDACFFIYIHHVNDMERAVRFLYKIYNQSVLFLVRDPIERLKHAINHGWYAYEWQKAYDEYDIETNNIETILDRVQYIDIDDINYLLKNLNYWINIACFDFSNILKCVKTDIYYVDMSEILPNVAFDTMKKLSNVFNFEPPKEENKQYYEEIKSSKFRYILPIVVRYKDLKINITLKNEIPLNCVDIEKYIKCKHEIQKLIGFSIDRKDMDKISYLYLEHIISFFSNFLIQIDKKTKLVEKKKATSVYILKH